MNPIILKDRAMADKKKTLLKAKQDASGWLSYYVSLANEEK